MTRAGPAEHDRSFHFQGDGGKIRLVPMRRYAVVAFLSAFLLFLVQPLIAKAILPWFGGAPAVWTTAMLFFQLLLLGGYAYAHFASRLTARQQAALQIGLLAVSLLFLPIIPAA